MTAATRAAVRAARAWGALAVVQATVTIGGFDRLRRLLASDTGTVASGPDHRGVLLSETWHAVERARRFFPAHVACLQRAAASVYMLRHSGVPAELVIGVRKAPFEAHAWVELDGRVVGSHDDADAASSYVTITRV